MLAEFTRDHWPWFGLVVACVFGALTAPIWRSLSRESLLGLVCFVVTFMLATAYLWAPERQTAILIWQAHMFGLLLMYSVATLSRAPSWIEPIPGLYVVFICLYTAIILWTHGLPPILETNIERRSVELFTLAMVPALVWIYTATLDTDWTAIAIWTVLALWETWAAVAYLLCAVLIPDIYGLNGQWGISVNKMACSRAWGEPLSKLPTFIATALIICILSVHFCRQKLPALVKRFTA